MKADTKAVMSLYEAITIARTELFYVGNLETVTVNGRGYAIPKERDKNGAAKNSRHQEIADAYNVLADKQLYEPRC